MENKKKFKPNQDLRLMGQVQEVLRYYHYAYRTEQTYCDWIKRFLKFYDYKKHPREMNAPEVERFLSHLATQGQVAAATQRQALNAIVFLYRDVLESGLQKAVKTAVRKAGITKRAGCHTMRHSYATHLLENGVNIRMVQELMGHKDVKTTEIYTHVMNKDLNAVQSPLDTL